LSEFRLSFQNTPRFIKKEPEPNSAYFDNHKFKLYGNRSNTRELLFIVIIKCCWFNFSLFLSQIRKISNTSSEQAEMTRYNANHTKPSKIIIYTKAVGHTA